MRKRRQLISLPLGRPHLEQKGISGSNTGSISDHLAGRSSSQSLSQLMAVSLVSLRSRRLEHEFARAGRVKLLLGLEFACSANR